MRYLLGMSKSYPALERKYWLETKAGGRKRFILRGMLESVLFWLVVMPLIERFGFPRHSFPTESDILIALGVLPLVLLGGYLTANWRWQDFEKKYPENSLPPWE